MQKTANELRQRAAKLRNIAEHADGRAYHQDMQEVQHLLSQAEALDKNSAQTPCNDPTRKKDLAKIHLLKKKAGLDNDSYRDALQQLTGQRSAKELSVTQRTRVIRYLYRQTDLKKSNGYPNRPKNTDSNAQMQKIEALLAEAKLPWAYASAIAKRQYKKERLQFCSSEQLRGVITALIKKAKKEERRT